MKNSLFPWKFTIIIWKNNKFSKKKWSYCTKKYSFFVGNSQNDCWLFNRFEYNKLKILNPWKDLWNFIDLIGYYVAISFWTFDWDITDGQQARTSKTDFRQRHHRRAAGKDIKDGHRVKTTQTDLKAETSKTDIIREWECLSGNQNRKGGKRNG